MRSRSPSTPLRLLLLFLLSLIPALALLAGLAGPSAWAAGMWTVGAAIDDLPGESPALNGVAFTDARRGWLCGFEPNGQEGFVFVTTNGGATWRKQFSFATTGTVYDVAFPDVKHGWVVGDSTAYVTSDGGTTWVLGGIAGRAVGFADAAHGCIAWDSYDVPPWSSPGGIGYTADGTTWHVGEDPTDHERWSDAAMADATHGWVVGTDRALIPLIVATTDGGATWAQQTSPSSAGLAAVSAPDANHAWAVGVGGTIIATDDGGATWRPQASGVTNNLFDVAFPDAKHGWAVGRRDDGHLVILATTDGGGAHWKRQATSSHVQQQRVSSLAFPDARHGWGVGSVGFIRYHAAPRITRLSPTRGPVGCKLTNDWDRLQPAPRQEHCQDRHQDRGPLPVLE